MLIGAKAKPKRARKVRVFSRMNTGVKPSNALARRSNAVIAAPAMVVRKDVKRERGVGFAPNPRLCPQL